MSSRTEKLKQESERERERETIWSRAIASLDEREDAEGKKHGGDDERVARSPWLEPGRSSERLHPSPSLLPSTPQPTQHSSSEVY